MPANRHVPCFTGEQADVVGGKRGVARCSACPAVLQPDEQRRLRAGVGDRQCPGVAALLPAGIQRGRWDGQQRGEVRRAGEDVAAGGDRPAL